MEEKKNTDILTKEKLALVEAMKKQRSWVYHFNALPGGVRRLLCNINALLLKKVTNFCEDISLNFHLLIEKNGIKSKEDLEFNEYLDEWFFKVKKNVKKLTKNFDELSKDIKNIAETETKEEIENLILNLPKKKFDHEFMKENFSFSFKKSTLRTRLESIMKVTIGEEEYNGLKLTNDQNTTFRVINFLRLIDYPKRA